MSHINLDTLQDYKQTHQSIHYLLKRYYEDQTVTDEELVKELENIKDGCSYMIDAWNNYLEYE